MIPGPPASNRVAGFSHRRRFLERLLGAAALSGLSAGSAAGEVAHPARLSAWSLPAPQGLVQWAPTESASSRPWLYLDFWASWCAPCRLSFPWMNSLQEQWSREALRVVAVSVDRRRDEALAFLRSHPARFEVALDPQAALARGVDVRTMPTSLLVAPDGRIVQRHEGFTPRLAQEAARSIGAALGQRL